MDRAEEEWYNRGIATLSLSERGGPSQTGPTDCLHQCGNKRLCRLGVTPSISTLGSQMSEAPFCLYAACLLIEILHTGHSRLIPHQWKGCLGPVCPAPPRCATLRRRRPRIKGAAVVPRPRGKRCGRGDT